MAQTNLFAWLRKRVRTETRCEPENCPNSLVQFLGVVSIVVDQKVHVFRASSSSPEANGASANEHVLDTTGIHGHQSVQFRLRNSYWRTSPISSARLTLYRGMEAIAAWCPRQAVKNLRPSTPSRALSAARSRPGKARRSRRLAVRCEVGVLDWSRRPNSGPANYWCRRQSEGPRKPRLHDRKLAATQSPDSARLLSRIGLPSAGYVGRLHPPEWHTPCHQSVGGVPCVSWRHRFRSSPSSCSRLSWFARRRLRTMCAASAASCREQPPRIHSKSRLAGSAKSWNEWALTRTGRFARRMRRFASTSSGSSGALIGLDNHQRPEPID